MNVYYSSPRASNFDEMWSKHERLVYWWACKLSKIFHCSKDDFLGWLTLRFNYICHHWVRAGRFSTFFSLHMFTNVRKEVVAQDSLTYSAWLWNKTHTSKFELARKTYDFGVLAQQVPVYYGTVDWEQDVIDCFDNLDAMWIYLTKNCTERQRQALMFYFRDGNCNFAETGRNLKLSKQRIQQLVESGLIKVEWQLKRLNDWTALFKKSN